MGVQIPGLGDNCHVLADASCHVRGRPSFLHCNAANLAFCDRAGELSMGVDATSHAIVVLYNSAR